LVHNNGNKNIKHPKHTVLQLDISSLLKRNHILNSFFTDISMQDKMVIYDNEKQLIGWMPANCDRLPKWSKTVSI